MGKSEADEDGHSLHKQICWQDLHCITWCDFGQTRKPVPLFYRRDDDTLGNWDSVLVNANRS